MPANLIVDNHDFLIAQQFNVWYQSKTSRQANYSKPAEPDQEMIQCQVQQVQNHLQLAQQLTQYIVTENYEEELSQVKTQLGELLLHLDTLLDQLGS